MLLDVRPHHPGASTIDPFRPVVLRNEANFLVPLVKRISSRSALRGRWTLRCDGWPRYVLAWTVILHLQRGGLVSAANIAALTPRPGTEALHQVIDDFVFFA